MEAPTHEQFLDVLRSDKNRGGIPSVLSLMRNEIDPKIRRMSKAQLAEAFSGVVYAMYCLEAEGFVLEDAIEALHQDRLMWKLTAGRLEVGQKTAKSDSRKEVSEKALDARHKVSREKHEAIRGRFATGKYSSRERCAEEEYADLGMLFGTARKALRNTPDPDPWPAKNRS